MTDTANNSVPKQTKLQRFTIAAGAWLKAFDYSIFDYTQNRINVLEREVARLTEEMRRSRPVDSGGSVDFMNTDRNRNGIEAK